MGSLLAVSGVAQSTTGALRGQVADPSGAAIPGATVIMTPATGSPIAIKSDGQGNYEFKSLPAGKYVLTVAAAGFTLYENDNVVVADQPLRLNVTHGHRGRDPARAGFRHCADHRRQSQQQRGRDRDFWKRT